MASNTNSKVNLRKSLEDGLIPAYPQSVSDAILSLLSCGFQSVTELNNEIISVSKSISSLRKQSRKIWEQWKSASRPHEGTLYEEKRDANKNECSPVCGLVPCQGRTSQKFRLRIHYSGKATTLVSDPQTPELNAKVSESTTSALTHK